MSQPSTPGAKLTSHKNKSRSKSKPRSKSKSRSKAKTRTKSRSRSISTKKHKTHASKGVKAVRFGGKTATPSPSTNIASSGKVQRLTDLVKHMGKAKSNRIYSTLRYSLMVVNAAKDSK